MYGPYPPAYPPPYGGEHYDHYAARRMSLELAGQAADMAQPKATFNARVWVGSRSRAQGIRSCEDAGALQKLRGSVAGAAWVMAHDVHEVGGWGCGRVGGQDEVVGAGGAPLMH